MNILSKARGISILLISMLLLFSCHDNKEKVIRDSRIAMGTSVTITVYNEKDEEKLSGAFDLLYQLENLISAKKEGTYIYTINQKAGKERVAVPEEIFNLIKFTLYLNQETEGAFDPAIGALSELWGIASDNPHLPSKEELEITLPLLDPSNIVLDEENLTVFLEKEGMKLDLGGIGKGYAADKLKAYLIENGVEKGIIDLGGNILVFGQKSDSSKWKIGIMDPENTSFYFTSVEIDEGSVVTSGPYERFFIKDGVSYHHILDPKTGYPYDSELLSATIISDSSTLADGLSTSTFALREGKAEEIAKKFGVHIILLTKDGRILDYDYFRSSEDIN